ncbi:MAG TPA: VanZ family protein [Dehalococcoidia bacterium]|nr:VanZ family protein [Dehalococcoidia bacterium]
MPVLRRGLSLLSGWPAVVVLAALIFALSSVPNLAAPRAQAVPLDKVEHAGEYAALAFALAGACRRHLAWPVPLLLACAAALAALYGVSDEFHQRFVPGRDAAVTDWLADVAGAAAGALASGALLRAGDLRRGGSA